MALPFENIAEKGTVLIKFGGAAFGQNAKNVLVAPDSDHQ